MKTRQEPNSTSTRLKQGSQQQEVKFQDQIFKKNFRTISGQLGALLSAFRLSKAQNPLHQFPRDFPVHGEADNLLRTCRQQDRNKSVVSFGRRPGTTDFCHFRSRYGSSDATPSAHLNQSDSSKNVTSFITS